jgi:hypothetical protein
MKRPHLVDGTFELFRAYYAVPSSGRRTAGSASAASWLDAVWLRDGTVTHVAVATDQSF